MLDQTVPTAPADDLGVQQLLSFYAASARDLPWRTPDADPWAVLVSEVMLQQTPVARVLPVYLDWMRRWPAPSDLAATSTGEAVRAWGRLGYPRRALRLHAAATVITDQHGGRVPDDLDALLALPGVGDYTARAVAAFAFGARVPVVDTNVRRVLNRLVRGTDDAGPATAADRTLMDTLLPDDAPTAALLSVAVMEFGALLCTASRPRCDACPVADRCRWLAAGQPAGIRGPGQAWNGTDRQVRGRIMAVLRDSDVPVALDALRSVSPSTAQGERCLAGLLADGLAVAVGTDRIALPD